MTRGRKGPFLAGGRVPFRCGTAGLSGVPGAEPEDRGGQVGPYVGL
jgi:hypothetical protein